MLYIIIRSTHILNHNLTCAQAEKWDLKSLSCGKWRKISKNFYGNRELYLESYENKRTEEHTHTHTPTHMSFVYFS